MAAASMMRQRGHMVDKKHDPPASGENHFRAPLQPNGVIKQRPTGSTRRTRRKKSNNKSALPLISGGLACIVLLALMYVSSSPEQKPTASTIRSLVAKGLHRNYNDGPPKDLVIHGSRDSYTPCPPEYRKRAWAGFADDKNVARAFRHNGWFVSSEEEDFKAGTFQILYTKRIKEKGTFASGLPWQRYSRIPGGKILGAKDTFFEGFRVLQEDYEKKIAHNEYADGGDTKKNLIYFLPETYQLEQKHGRKEFKRILEEEKESGNIRPWVLKKAKLNNGEGIEMLAPDSPELYSAVDRAQADHENDYVVQKYICNELTWFGGKKFDLRFYWMIASVDPLIVLYHDGYARVAEAMYDETDFGSTGQHLTNHAFRGEVNKVDEDVRADALWRRVREHYEGDKARLKEIIPGGDPVRHLRNQMKEAISTTMEAFKDTLTLTGPDNTSNPMENLFAFYGADFVIDADLDVYYLEAQTGPGLGEEYDYRIEMFRDLFRPMINIVEEIAMKQETDAKANLLPIESLGDWEIVYAGDWRYQYEGYERSKDKKGCTLPKTVHKKVHYTT